MNAKVVSKTLDQFSQGHSRLVGTRNTDDDAYIGTNCRQGRSPRQAISRSTTSVSYFVYTFLIPRFLSLLISYLQLFPSITTSPSPCLVLSISHLASFHLPRPRTSSHALHHDPPHHHTSNKTRATSRLQPRHPHPRRRLALPIPETTA